MVCGNVEGTENHSVAPGSFNKRSIGTSADWIELTHSRSGYKKNGN